MLEIGAGTGLLSVVACLLGESISGVSNLSDTEHQAGHVLPHIIPDEQTPASQRDPGLCSYLSQARHECQMRDAVLLNAIQSKAKYQNISLNPALTVPL